MSEQRRILNKQTMGIADGLPLQASEGGIEELRQDIQRLMDMEAIKQLKHRYFRCVDTFNMEEMKTVLHKDVKIRFKGGNYEWNLDDRDQYIANMSYAFTKKSIGQHNGFHPEIQMLSDHEATGIWYLHDNMWIMNHKLKTHGTALYWDRYVKENGQWFIAETAYERLYELNDPITDTLNLSTHYLGTHGADPQ
ncbi:nuclear transport factor 2 family protein [Oceanicoccus sp. KOV_DT_Chl]|uniref:nuclear transport factor 2 family protein n=1 Tax=Oceanicoccus sp. KOV_DT_Chl TaxID=1904639 RepID=UPI000C7BF04C|nr:nuclear transport factor 2 family protein [Oceanicoccus sp. KOV_DT_Chl]